MMPASHIRPSAKSVGLFRIVNGKNCPFTFLLVFSLFLLWRFCRGLLDNLNRHFQNLPQFSKFQSGFFQNAFYMGYFLMALPAGMVSKKFGYKGAPLMGYIADKGGMKIGFVIPLICFAVIAAYGALWRKLETRGCETLSHQID
jgi:fucose permease